MQNVNYKEIGSIDLNVFNIVGIYKVTSTCSNQPSNINTPYILENYEGFQIIRTLNRIYFRKRDPNTNVWSSWADPISDLQNQHNQDIQNLQNQHNQDIQNLQNYDAYLYSLINSIQISSIPVGAILFFPTNYVPYPFVPMEGQQWPKFDSQNNKTPLWNFVESHGLLGTAHSGFRNYNSSFFLLPDYRGAFIRGHGASPVSGSFTSAGLNGWQSHEILSHSHWLGYGFSIGGWVTINCGYDHTWNDYWAHCYHPYSANTGGSENRPYNIALKVCIKYA